MIKKTLAVIGGVATLAGGVWTLSTMWPCLARDMYVCEHGMVSWVDHEADGPVGCVLAASEVCNPDEARNRRTCEPGDNVCGNLLAVEVVEMGQILAATLAERCAPCPVTSESWGPCPTCLLDNSCAERCPAPPVLD